MKLLLLTFGLIFPMSFIFSQEKKEVTTTTPNESVIYETLKMSDLELNGINSSEMTNLISNEDLIKLRNFDFSIYRIYNKSQKVQILDGPLIEIYSIEQMISLGQNFEMEFIESKKNIDYSNVTHEVIPLINIGFGKISADEIH